jgi:pimeloyl-ACP methyl ester carboxylesterase
MATPGEHDKSTTTTAGATTTAVTETHVFGGTLVPGWLASRFYAPLGRRLAAGGPVEYHAMTPHGGLGRTDRVVDSFRPLMESAVDRGAQVRLAGHSLGGVVAWALAHDYPDAVDQIEVWGAPLRGTAVARFFRHLGAEARFLLPASRWLSQYDRPLNGPSVRSYYTACDVLVLPPRRSSWVEGDRAENHFLAPLPLPRPAARVNEHVHAGWCDHLLLPRHGRLLATTAA